MSLNDKKKFPSNAEKRMKIKEIKNDELNKECFDCGSCYPEYISINNGVFICKDCLHIHNKFPKQVSTTLKNNLSSLNSKELEFMYLGGNQKLLEFINYEYPQLQKFKINILYQTKAMQYYRNNLHYKVYGGPKPVKPSENINAYEIVDANDLAVKNEKIANKQINKINNRTIKEPKRNKSLTKMEIPKKKDQNQDKNRTVKFTEEVNRNAQLNTTTEDSLKRHKSFYKEMNKLFGSDLNNDLDDVSEGSTVYKKQKVKKDKYRRKSDFDLNDEKNKYSSQTNIINQHKFQKYPVEHIYNNNYFTLSATKNIFMFTPNKDSIIYKHRKINDPNNTTNTNNDNPEQSYNKEIYYKPKIPYLLNSNRQKKPDNNDLFFSLPENTIKITENKNKENNITNNLNSNTNINNNNIKSLNTYTLKNRKSRKMDVLEDINNDSKQNIPKDDNDIKYIENISNINITNNKTKGIIEENNNKNQGNEKKEMFVKKTLYKIKNDRYNDEKNSNYIILRNNKNHPENNENNEQYNKNIIHKTELKEIKIEKIIKSISNIPSKKESNNSINNNEQIKNKTYTGNYDAKRRKLNEKILEKKKKNPIRIEEGDEENSSPQKCENFKEYNINIEIKNDKNNIIENKRTKTENKIEENDNKIYTDPKKHRMARYFKKDEIKDFKENDKNKNKEKDKDKEKDKEKDKDKEKKYEKNKKEIEKKEEKKYNIKNEIIPQNIKTENNRRIHKIAINDNFMDIKKNKIIEEKPNKNKDLKNKENIENNNNDLKKFSIRNKYKMKRMNEME